MFIQILPSGKSQRAFDCSSFEWGNFAAIFDRRMGLDKKHNEALTMQVSDYLENRTKP